MIRMIVARSRNGIIGSQGDIPWRLRDDMRFFRKTTLNNTVIMGRKTFESIGKPLENRKNIVLTRDPSYQHPGVLVAHSMDKALEMCGGEAFIIGGQQVYETFLPLVDEIFITEVDAHIEGDTRFPDPEGDWHAEEIARHGQNEENEYGFTIYRLTRSKGSIRESVSGGVEASNARE